MGALQFVTGGVKLLLDLLSPSQLVLLGLPFRGQRNAGLLELGEFLLEPLQPFVGRRIVLLLERFALDLELDDATVELVDLFGLGIHFHAPPTGGLIDEIDGLVGQESVRDVAVRQCRGGDDRTVGDANTVMKLVLLLQPAQDGNGVLDGRFRDEYGLETTGQRTVLLDMLAIFIECGGTDTMQLATRQSWFSTGWTHPPRLRPRPRR